MSTAQMTELIRLAQKGRLAEKRNKAFARWVTSALANILAAFMGGFFLMIGVGIAHNDWWPGVPPMGYWTAVLLVGVLRGVLSRLPEVKDKDS